MQRERAHREIEPAQAQRRQAEDDAEQAPTRAARRQRDPERRVGLPEQDADRERAGRHQAGVAERDLAGIAGEQHQRERADAGEEDLAGEIELEGGGDERERQQREDEHGKAPRSSRVSVRARSCGVAGAEIAAGARLPRHGRAPRGCRTGPRAHDQHGDEHQERHHVGQQRIDVVDGEHLGAGHDQRADERAHEAVEPADQRRREGLEPDHHHGLVEAGIERDQHAGDRSGQGRKPPGQRVDGVQVDAALRRQQRVLPGARMRTPQRPKRRKRNRPP